MNIFDRHDIAAQSAVATSRYLSDVPPYIRDLERQIQTLDYKLDMILKALEARK